MGRRPTAPHTGSTAAFFRHLTRLTVMAGLLLSGVWWGCDSPGGPAPGSLQNENILRYDVNAPFKSLDPTAVEFSGSTHVFPLLYSYLFVPDENGELTPDLARRWGFDARARQWTIDLRPDARLHDQLTVTARDVKFSLEAFMAQYNPDLKSIIARISAVADHVLTIDVKQNDPQLLHKLCYFEIVPQAHADSPNNAVLPVGSGPFRFAGRQGDRQVALAANPDYYGGRPSLEQIVFNFQPDREKAWIRLLSGATDIAQEISPQNYYITSEYTDWFYFDTYTLNFYTILLYNTHDARFSDPAVRQALSLGIDRGYLVTQILKGYGRIAVGPMGVDSPFHDPSLKPLPFDPDQARALLLQAGWNPDKNGRLHKDGRPFEFTILVFEESQVEKQAARFIQLCLNSLGITAHVQDLPFEDLKARYFKNTAFEAVLTELNGAFRNPDFVKMLWSAGAGGQSDAGGFDHPTVNRLFEKAYAENDPAAKKIRLQELDRLIAGLQPGTFLFQKTALDAMSRRFSLPHPFSLTYEGIYRLKDAALDPAYRQQHPGAKP